MFITERGDRANTSNAIVLLTDGGSDDFSKTIEEGRLTRLSGVKVGTRNILVLLNTTLNAFNIQEQG